jgi:hypothetical protein
MQSSFVSKGGDKIPAFCFYPVGKPEEPRPVAFGRTAMISSNDQRLPKHSRTVIFAARFFPVDCVDFTGAIC